MTFPHHRGKHRGTPLFSALDFHRYATRRSGTARPRVPSGLVLVFGQRWTEYLRRSFGRTFDRATGVYTLGDSVGVVQQHGPGSPYTAILVEELAALGAKRFLAVGIAGSLRPDLSPGSFVLCTRALRDEGTSYHYVAPGDFAYPSAPLTRRVRATLRRAKAPFTEGGSWTTDAAYRETVAELRRYRARGLLTVEMEASALFTIARVRGLEAAALFVISDVLDERGWEPRFHDSRRPLRAALGIAAETLAGTRVRSAA